MITNEFRVTNNTFGDTPLITNDMVEKALQVLSTTAKLSAAARAIRLRAEYHRKQVRAELVLASKQKSADLRSADAESSKTYSQACEQEVMAVEDDEFYRAERNDAAVVLESWRTEEASRRAGSSFR